MINENASEDSNSLRQKPPLIGALQLSKAFPISNGGTAEIAEHL